MDGLDRANRKLAVLKDVRVVHLPPMTVASIHCVGQDSEGNARRQMNQFDIQLDLLYPIRMYEEKDECYTPIENSVELCGYKACLVVKRKFNVIGYTKILMQNMTEDDFKQELIADDRFDFLISNIKEGTPILSFVSYDSECHNLGGRYRFTSSIITWFNDIANRTVPCFAVAKPLLH